MPNTRRVLLVLGYVLSLHSTIVRSDESQSDSCPTQLHETRIRLVDATLSAQGNASKLGQCTHTLNKTKFEWKETYAAFVNKSINASKLGSALNFCEFRLNSTHFLWSETHAKLVNAKITHGKNLAQEKLKLSDTHHKLVEAKFTHDENLAQERLKFMHSRMLMAIIFSLFFSYSGKKLLDSVLNCVVMKLTKQHVGLHIVSYAVHLKMFHLVAFWLGEHLYIKFELIDTTITIIVMFWNRHSQEKFYSPFNLINFFETNNLLERTHRELSQTDELKLQRARQIHLCCITFALVFGCCRFVLQAGLALTGIQNTNWMDLLHLASRCISDCILTYSTVAPVWICWRGQSKSEDFAWCSTDRQLKRHVATWHLLRWFSWTTIFPDPKISTFEDWSSFFMLGSDLNNFRVFLLFEVVNWDQQHTQFTTLFIQHLWTFITWCYSICHSIISWLCSQIILNIQGCSLLTKVYVSLSCVTLCSLFSLFYFLPFGK